MDLTPDIHAVLAAYPSELQPTRCEELGSAGGFSGAHLWRLTAPAGTFCLRRWPPEHPSAERLVYIHAVLRHVADRGLRIVPAPRRTTRGETFVPQRGCLWEIAPWLPGTADFQRDPRPSRLVAAVQAVARFHAASELFPGLSREKTPSPGLADRLTRLAQLQQDEVARLNAAIQRQPSSPLVTRARRLMALFPRLASPIESQLKMSSRVLVQPIPCLRDIWHDHVLFVGDEVTGLVDFGALRNDSVAGDLARLLGSLVGDDADRWRLALEAYQAIRPLAAEDMQLLAAFDRSTVLLSGMNWLRWIYLEGRCFERMELILERLDGIVQRAERLSRTEFIPSRMV